MLYRLCRIDPGISHSRHRENTNLCVNCLEHTTITASMSSPKPPSQSTLNPKTTEYEFLGTPGALLVSLGCPFLVFALIFLCNDAGCPPRDMSSWTDKLPSSLAEFIDWKAIKWYFSFQVALVLLWVMLPGKWVRGRPLRNGTQLEYKTNGKAPLCCWSFVMFGGGLSYSVHVVCVYCVVYVVVSADSWDSIIDVSLRPFSWTCVCRAVGVFYSCYSNTHFFLSRR